MPLRMHMLLHYTTQAPSISKGINNMRRVLECGLLFSCGMLGW
jgi:hypothetical protein